MITRVLFLTANIPFAASIRAALERTGTFEVRPFSLPDAAVEYLRENPIDVAIVDFGMPGMRVDQVVGVLRTTAPQIAIVAIPRQHEEVMRLLRLQNSINVPFSARYIIPVLHKAVADIRSNPPALPQTRPSVKPSLPTTMIFNEDTPVVSTDNLGAWQVPEAVDPSSPQVDAAFQEILNNIEPSSATAQLKPSDFNQLVNSMRADQQRESLPTRQQQYVDLILKGAVDPLATEMEGVTTPLPIEPNLPEERPALSQSAFDRLAEEEPPPPTLEESGTVSDLITGVNERGFRNVLAVLRGDELEQTPPPQNMFADAPATVPEMPIDMPELFAPDASEPSAPVVYDFDSIPPAPPDTLPEEPSHINTAQIILEEAQDTSRWLNAFSLEDLIASIERQQSAHRPKIRPLPSWIKESSRQMQRGKDEAKPLTPPDTLPEMPPPAPSDVMSLSQQFADQPTRMSSAQEPIVQQPEDWDTMWETPSSRQGGRLEESQAETPPPFESLAPHFAPDTLPESIPDYFAEKPPSLAEEFPSFVLASDDEWTNFPPPQTAVYAADDWEEERETPTFTPADAHEEELPRFATEDFNTEFERLSSFEFAARQRAAAGDSTSVENPYLAQLALSLTQVSLELTAEATLLTHDMNAGGGLAAYAGHMAPEDVDELRTLIADDWNVNDEEARMRFITLPASGKDYMLYSRRTIDGLILSLVFAGSTPLKDIRRQGRRLLEALKTVPDMLPPGSAAAMSPMSQSAAMRLPMPAASMRIEPPPDLGPYMGYACVWVLRDPNGHLEEPVTQAITAGMNTQLREQFWRIQDLQAREDYVYLYADVPGETPAFSIIRDLKRRSAEIAHKTNPELPRDLWADGYLVVTPGRTLEEDEIQQFINFERME